MHVKKRNIFQHWASWFISYSMGTSPHLPSISDELLQLQVRLGLRATTGLVAIEYSWKYPVVIGVALEFSADLE